MEQLLPLLIQLIGGGVGGNIAGTLLKNIDLSRLAQTIVGIIGGIAGGQAINWMGVLESVLGGRVVRAACWAMRASRASAARCSSRSSA